MRGRNSSRRSRWQLACFAARFIVAVYARGQGQPNPARGLTGGSDCVSHVLAPSFVVAVIALQVITGEGRAACECVAVVAGANNAGVRRCKLRLVTASAD